MKNRFFSKLCSMMLAALIAVSTISFSTGTAMAASNVNSEFYQQLAQMIQSQDGSHYFGTMELAVGSNAMTLDGETIPLDVSAEIRNERTMLPIRHIAEACGATVDYDPKEKVVIIKSRYGDLIEIPVGSSSMNYNSQVFTLDSPAYVKNSRTYVPVRVVAESLELDVAWNQETSTVTITAPYQTCRILAWTDVLNPDNLGAEKVIHDEEFWVLQFATPSQARKALQMLEAEQITAAPDLYIPPIEHLSGNSDVQAGQNDYSWGVDACNFDSFIEKNTSLFSGKSKVAVVDTGVDDSHSFFQGCVSGGYDFVDGDYDADDEHYHGTHVAGIIVDCMNDVGVEILPVRVLDSGGSGTTATVVSGVKYAGQKGADVINLSLGGGRDNNDVLDAAIQEAIRSGSIVVAAAGNDADNTSYYCPAHMDVSGMVVVSAGDRNLNSSYFTNYGSSVDVMAPGENIKAAAPGNSYRTLSGTSMAAPHVSAAAALLKMTGQYSNAADLEEALHFAATNEGVWRDSYYGYGFLDMSRVESPEEEVTPNPEPTLVRYEFLPEILLIQKGLTEEIKLFAYYSDGTKKDVTASANLYSTDPSIAKIDREGNLTALEEGRTYISFDLAVSNGISVPNPVTVDVIDVLSEEPDPTDSISRYEWSVDAVDLQVGETADVSLYAIYESGLKTDVTEKADLYSKNSRIANVNGKTITGIQEGTTYVSFSFASTDSISVPAPLKVTVTEPYSEPEPEPESYSKLYWMISGSKSKSNSAALSVGRTLQIDICGEGSNGTLVNLTSICQPYSSDESVVTISPDGKMTSVGPGTAYIWLRNIPNANLEMPPLLEITVN